MRLYDTVQKDIIPFEPDELVTIYTCGITPYDATHLGHATTYLTYDLLQRRLRDLGHTTRCVRNVTDVDDDILRQARKLGVHYLDLAAATMARFNADMESLNMLPCWSEPRATSAISDIRGFIGMVLESGHAYEVDGTIYFEVAKYDGWGELSGYDKELMIKLSAERGADPDDPNKRDPLDFVLWQPSAEDEPSWGSLWGDGRPGWHIECSTLAMRELSPTIDLHGGGDDLIFPHHECERAQSEAITGQTFSRHWMHQAMVELEGEKMSKSLGNMVFVNDLVEDYDPRTVRLALINNHYRKPWSYTSDLLESANERLNTWLKAGEGSGGLEEARIALDEDLATPEAIIAIDKAAKKGLGVSQAAELLGVELKFPNISKTP